MGETPGLSVVIPARNDAVALDRCLSTLSRQTLVPTEIVVVDNASSDRTAEVARSYGARVVHEPRVGIPMAAAAGYDAARADIIARVDADSIVPPAWTERIATILSGGRWDAVTGFGRFYEFGPLIGGVGAAFYLAVYYGLSGLALGSHALWGSNMALRREVWLEVRDVVHRNDPEVHDDLDLAFALGPERRIRLDRNLTVSASSRGLRGATRLRRRLRRACRTLAVNWQAAPPWQRWAHRLNRDHRRRL